MVCLGKVQDALAIRNTGGMLTLELPSGIRLITDSREGVKAGTYVKFTYDYINKRVCSVIDVAKYNLEHTPYIDPDPIEKVEVEEPTIRMVNEDGFFQDYDGV